MTVKTEPLEWTIWSEPLERANCRVMKSDIEKAITWYRELTGYYPDAICLSRKNAELVQQYGNIPDEITVYTKGGCLSWEIWLSGKINELPSLTPADNSHQTNPSSVTKPRRGTGSRKTTRGNYDTTKNKRNGATKSKISDSGNYATSGNRGRPRKEGNVHRSTDYRRRKKELQGTLKI